MIISLCLKMTVYDTKIKNVFLFNVLFFSIRFLLCVIVVNPIQKENNHISFKRKYMFLKLNAN